MHSSRMPTARTLTVHGGCLPRGVSAGGMGWVSAWGVSAQGGVCWGVSAWGWGVCPGGVPCNLSHDAFDVSCMLPPHQLRLNTSAAAYIVLAHCMMGYTSPPVDRMTHTCKNITFPQTLFAGGNDTSLYSYSFLHFPIFRMKALGLEEQIRISIKNRISKMRDIYL